MEFTEFSVPFLACVFVVAAAIISIFGSMMTRIADRLADVTGLGEALMGAIFLGGSTSIPGVITSVTAAYEGYPKLAISNAIGGIAAQTAFLAIADIAYRKANLEHAAASIANMMQGTLLVGIAGFVHLSGGRTAGYLFSSSSDLSLVDCRIYFWSFPNFRGRNSAHVARQENTGNPDR